MSLALRIIPRLDIKGPNLVKGINFEGLRVLGKPEDFARHYYEQGADELIYQDVVASLYGRNSLKDIISRMKGWQLNTFKESYNHKIKNLLLLEINVLVLYVIYPYL